MDFITSKVLIIGVGIFVTLTIFTCVMIVFSNVNAIFDVVENTDTSIYNQYDNLYYMYNDATLNSVGMLNTLRKYEDDEDIHILISFDAADAPEEKEKSEFIEEIENYIDAGYIGYETQYNVSIKEEGPSFHITFIKK